MKRRTALKNILVGAAAVPVLPLLFGSTKEETFTIVRYTCGHNIALTEKQKEEWKIRLEGRPVAPFFNPDERNFVDWRKGQQVICGYCCVVGSGSKGFYERGGIGRKN